MGRAYFILALPCSKMSQIYSHNELLIVQDKEAPRNAPTTAVHTPLHSGGLSTLPHGIGLHACLHYLGEPVFTTSGACRPQGEGHPRGKVALGRHLIVLASLVLTSCTSSRLELHESSIDPPPTHTQLIALNSQSHLTTSVGAALGVSHLPAIATYQR